VAERYSRAVRGLAAAATRCGIQVSPREIERWRQRQLVPQPERTYPGHGSLAIYPDGAAKQVAEVAKLLDSGWKLDDVAVGLFVRGYDLDEETVKLAFKAHAERARRLLTRRAPDGDTLTVPRPRRRRCFGRFGGIRASRCGAGD